MNTSKTQPDPRSPQPQAVHRRPQRAQNREMFGTIVPNSDAAAKYSHASWVEVPSALPEDTAPSARLGAQGSARSYCRTQSAA